LRAFGENYVQEAIAKMDAAAGLEWHLIGPLQSNKSRLAAQRFDWVQSVDSAKIAQRLSEQRPADLAPLNVLIQVNVSKEASKSGVDAEEVTALAREVAALPRLKLRGLMAIPAPGSTSGFAKMKALYESVAPRFGFDTLSMGMTDDMEQAIAEGSTMVRIGTAIFGPRGA
jgi:pyridoxal phosphate enzyme (YggS family)